MIRRGLWNVGLTTLSVGVFVAGIETFKRDATSRVPATQFVQAYTIDIRRPEVAQSLRYAPSGSTAADLVADATLRDVLLPANLSELSAEKRAVWTASVSQYDAQMSRAAELMLDAIRSEPGWPYHQSLLGQLVFARGSESLSPALVAQHTRWSVPMRIAASTSVHDSARWQALALAYLQTWPALATAHRPFATAAFSRAFEDPAFVRVTFEPAVNIVGIEAAMAALPAVPAVLSTAFEDLVRSKRLREAWQVYQRWDAAEWRERERDLIKIERYADRGDVDQTRNGCMRWAAEHSVWQYDSPAARRQAARILGLWPRGADGHWLRDSRGELVRYFLAGRTASIEGTVLANVVDDLEGVPTPVQAQVRVLASDIGGAEQIARSSETAGTLAWKPYATELTRHWLRRGDRARARDALGVMPAAARDECEPELLRAAVENRPLNVIPHSFTRRGDGRVDVPVCAGSDLALRFRLNVESTGGAVVQYGWDGGRSASLLTRSGTPETVCVPAVSGAHVFSARIVRGSEVVPIEVTGPEICDTVAARGGPP
jgi:hypothetical protein